MKVENAFCKLRELEMSFYSSQSDSFKQFTNFFQFIGNQHANRLKVLRLDIAEVIDTE